jgi:hypothetical protein
MPLTKNPHLKTEKVIVTINLEGNRFVYAIKSVLIFLLDNVE